MSSLPISRDAEYIHINSLDSSTQEEIRAIIDHGGVLHWDRNGEVRVVSNGVLSDVFQTYDFWSSAPDAYQADAPEGVGRIYWGDTQRLR